MKTTQQDEKFYKDFSESLKSRFHFDDEIIKEIYDKVDYRTNENRNFEYYKTSYEDEITEEHLQQFFDYVEKYYKDWFNSLDDVKSELECFLYDKYFRDSGYYYRDELSSELWKIEVNRTDWTIEIINWYEVLNTLSEELWILWLDVNFKDFFRNEYKCIIYTRDDYEDCFTSWFYDWDYLKDEYSKNVLKKLKNKPIILQKLCKINWFDIKDIFIYQEWNEKSKKYQKVKKIYEENECFRTLYNEFVNCLWYSEQLCFLMNLSIDDILSFYVKDSDFELWRNWSIWFDWSLFDVKLNKNLSVKTSDLSLWFYKNSRVYRTYDFCNSVFN